LIVMWSMNDKPSSTILQADEKTYGGYELEENEPAHVEEVM
jgi:hypothetical protein